MADSASSIGARMVRGAAWMVLLRSTHSMLGFISMLILARLLVPADFGLVALGMAIVGGLVVFSEFNFGQALIQNQATKREHYDTAWTLGLLRGFVLAGLVFLLAKPCAALFGDDRLIGLVSAMALFPLIEGMTNIGVVDFRKELVFHKEFVYRFSGRLAGVITTVSLAIIWQSYWALFFGQLVNQCLRLVLSYAMHPYRPRLSLSTWRELFHFSKWLLLNGIMGFSINRASTFVIAGALNASAVGLFTLSAEIASLIQQAAIAPLKRAFFPGYAKLGDVEAIKSMLLRAHGIVVLFAAPATIGIGITAELFVPILLGERWLDTVVIIEILALDAFLVAMQGQVRPAFLAVNRPAVTTYLSAVYAFTLIPALLMGVWSAGLVGVAWASVAARLVQIAAEFYALNKILNISFLKVLQRVWRSLVSCLALIGGVALCIGQFALPLSPTLVGQLINFFVVILIGVVTYSLSVVFLWRLSGCPKDSTEAIVFTALRRVISKRFGAPASSSESR